MTFPLPEILLFAILMGSGAQIVHGYLRATYCSPQGRNLVLLYEGAALAFSVALAAFAIIGVRNAAAIFPTEGESPISPLWALWVFALIAILCGYAALAGLEDREDYVYFSWTPATEALLACLLTPPIASLSQGLWNVFFVLAIAYMTLRTTVLLIVYRRPRRRIVSRASIAEAIKTMPEGVLYAGADKRITLENELMRQCLSYLEIPASVKNLDVLWSTLREKAQDSNSIQAVKRAGGFPPERDSQIVLRTGPDEARLFSLQSALPPGHKPASNEAFHYCVLAYDVTSEIRILERIEKANAELAASQHDLEASLETVQEVAENEAMLRMRGRVHDIIGQRLSMLHRALEDDAISDEEIEQIKPLLTGILEDLYADIDISPDDELNATVGAFEIAGVHIDVQGKLPDDPQRAKIISDCVREACTNAVKHAHARKVDVTIAERVVTIVNDGVRPAPTIREGTGLSRMRASIESAGGTLQIETEQGLFTLRIDLP